jgi:hypothetical protein
MKNADFSDAMLCGSYKNRRFGGSYHLYNQGEKNRWASNIWDTVRMLIPIKRQLYSEPSI